MLLHNVIPHTHESEITNEQHKQVHQKETSSPIGLLALIFHEFTEEGDMEDILIKAKTSISFATSFIVLPTINTQLSIIFFKEKESKQYFLPLKELRQSTGFSTAWSVRPPPFA